MEEQKNEKVEWGEIIEFIKKNFLVWISLIMAVLGGITNILDLCGMAFKEEGMRSWLVPISRAVLALGLLVFVFLIIYKMICMHIKREKQIEQILRKLEEKGNINWGSSERKSVNNRTERCHQIIIDKLDARTHFQQYTDDVTTELKRQLDDNEHISKLQIICYGRSGYAEVLRKISRVNPHANVDVIMYNVENGNLLSRNDDREQIDKHIIELKQRKPKAKIYMSDIPPLIRASALYVGEVPMWVAIQSYELQYNIKKEDGIAKGYLDLYRPDNSLIIICDKESSKKDFDSVMNYFKKEFERLKAQSKEAVLTESGKVEYREREHEEK